MKQSQLSFTTSKRIAGNLNGKGGKPKPTPAQLTSDSRRSSFERPIEVQDDSRSEDETETHARGDAEYNAVKKEETVAAVTKPSTKTSKTFRKLSEETKTTKIQQDPPKIDVTGLPDLNVKDKRWNGIYKEAKEAMGGQKPIHGKDDDRIVEILRIFDLNDEYGPCVGIPRLERWERAHAAGLEPPEEIYNILKTKQGMSDPRYSQSVFHSEVLE